MISECPNCSTQFNVTNEQLDLAEGDVRCGKCLAVFSATNYQIKPGASAGHSQADKSPPLSTNAIETDPKEITREWLAQLLPDGTESNSGDNPAELTNKNTIARLAQNALKQDAVQGQTETSIADKPELPSDFRENNPSENQRIEPSLNINSAEIDLNQFEALPIDIAAGNKFVSGKEKHLRKSTLSKRFITLFFIVLVMLAIHFAVSTMTSFIPLGNLFHSDNTWAKLTLFDRFKVIATFNQMRCRLVDCPSGANQHQYTVEQLIIRDHPSGEALLQVEAVIMNSATTAQSFPIFELRFSSLDGKEIAIKKFHPKTYLKGEAAGMVNMPANTPIHIAMEMNDPGDDAVNYAVKLKPLDASQILSP